MSEIRSTLKLKKSTVAGENPLPSELQVAELALNTADRKLYSKDHNGNVFPVFGSDTNDISFTPAPYCRDTAAHVALEASDAGPLTVSYPSHVEGDLLVLVFMNRDQEGADWTEKPDWTFHGKFLDNCGNDLTQAGNDLTGPQRLSVYSKRATSSEPLSIEVSRTDVSANGTQRFSANMISIANTAGIEGIQEEYDDGTQCSIASTVFTEERFHAVFYTHIWQDIPPNESGYGVTGAPGIYVWGGGHRLYNFYQYVDTTSTATNHTIDNSYTNGNNNHSAIVVSFSGPDTITVPAIVTSVQGKIGDVDVTLSECSDVALTEEPGHLWGSKVSVAPTANGEFQTTLNTPVFYVFDSAGRDNTSDLQLLVTGRKFWLSEDASTWVEYESTVDPVLDGVANTVTLTLDQNFLPSTNSAYVSLEDPANYALADGDALIWNSVTNLWESKRPEDAIKHLDDLVDVDLSTDPPVSGEVLEWNGAAWVPGDGSGLVSVSSVNGETGDVVLGIKDMVDYLSEGNRFEYYYSDKLASDLVPAGNGQWAIITANEIAFSGNATSGIQNEIAGPVIDQLVTGDPIWLSEDAQTWTSFLLVEDPSILGGYVRVVKIDGAGWTSTTEGVYLSLQDPTTIDTLVPRDQAALLYDGTIDKYKPGPPAVRKLVDFDDIDNEQTIEDKDVLRFDETRNLWYPSEVDSTHRYTFVKDINPQFPDAIFLVGPGLEEPKSPTQRNQYSENAGTGRTYPLIVERGREYIFDLSLINFLDPAAGNTPVRPWIRAWTGIAHPTIGGATTPPTGFGGVWDPVKRELRWTPPQGRAWDRYYIMLGSNRSAYESFGTWALLPAGAPNPAMEIACWFTVDLNSFPQDGTAYSTSILNETFNRYELDENVVPWHGHSNQRPMGDGAPANKSWYGSTPDPQGAPWQVSAHGSGDPLEGRITFSIAMPVPYSNQFGDGVQAVVTPIATYPIVEVNGISPLTTDFFAVNVVNSSPYYFTADFKNISGGTKVLPDAVSVWLSANQSSGYSGGFTPPF